MSQTLEYNDLSGQAKPAKNNSGKPRRSWLGRTARFVLWTLLVLFILILIVLGILYWIAGTDSGFARVTAIASERVPGLSIDGASGNLRHGITAESVTYANDTIDIKAAGLESGWRLGCLMQRKFCLDDLHIDALDVTTFATDEVDETPPRTEAIALPDIELPIDIALSDITIDTVRFQAPGDVPVQIVNDIHISAQTSDSQLTY